MHVFPSPKCDLDSCCTQTSCPKAQLPGSKRHILDQHVDISVKPDDLFNSRLRENFLHRHQSRIVRRDGSFPSFVMYQSALGIKQLITNHATDVSLRFGPAPHRIKAALNPFRALFLTMGLQNNGINRLQRQSNFMDFSNRFLIARWLLVVRVDYPFTPRTRSAGSASPATCMANIHDRQTP